MTAYLAYSNIVKMQLPLQMQHKVSVSFNVNSNGKLRLI